MSIREEMAEWIPGDFSKQESGDLLRMAAEADSTIARLEAELAEAKKETLAGWLLADERLKVTRSKQDENAAILASVALRDDDIQSLATRLAEVSIALAGVQYFPTGNPETDTMVDRIKAADAMLGGVGDRILAFTSLIPTDKKD